MQAPFVLSPQAEGVEPALLVFADRTGARAGALAGLARVLVSPRVVEARLRCRSAPNVGRMVDYDVVAPRDTYVE